MTRGEKVIAFIEKYCITPEGEHVGKPINLIPFQKKFILDVYDNEYITRKAILSIARKNGKTALIACILLAHLVGPEARQNSQIISGARSKKQASVVFELAHKIVQFSPQLQALIRVRPSIKMMIGLPMNVRYEALSAEAKTAHGQSPLLAILDEVGQVVGPKDAFTDAITTAQGAHKNPLLIAISTQAATDDDMLSLWIDDARESGDPRIVCHVYEADAGCDLQDESAWRAANPALGIFRSLQDVRDQALEATRMPSAENSYRNLTLNQRVNTLHSPFIPKHVWQSCGGQPIPLSPHLPVYGGIDLSGRADLTSMVLIQWVDGVWQVHPYFWTPGLGVEERSRRDKRPYAEWIRAGYLRASPGATVDYEFVAREMGEILEALSPVGINYDRWRFDILKKELDELGFQFPLKPFGQGFKDMSPAIDVLEAELLNGRIAHGGHPVLTMCASNAVTVKDPAGNRKLDKSKTTGRIDGIVALAEAFGAANLRQEEEFIMGSLIAV